MTFILLRKTTLSILCGLALTLSGAENAAQKVSDELLARARRGDVQAQLEAGFAFFKLNNPVRAAFWFSSAAMNGLPEAQYNLARCFADGYGVEKNLHQAMIFFQRAADQKLTAAQIELAKLYLSGIPAAPEANPPRPAVAADEKKAFALLQRLSEQDVVEAKVVFARYLVAKYHEDHEKIIPLLNQAADAGNVQSQIILADYLLSRTDSVRDEKRARDLLQKAAVHDPEALAKLAFAVENGFGAPPDPAAARQLYEQALQQKFSPLPAVRLANYLFTGSHGAVQDIPRAVKLYTAAAESGLPEALYRLGECCRDGIGTERDHGRAFEFFFQAAKADYPPAQYAVGRAFEKGEGTVKDQKAAFYWFNQSAMRQEPRGLLEAGRRYLQGNGVTADPVKAAAYLQYAFANGMNEAAELLEEARQKAAFPAIKEHPLPQFGLKPQ